MESTALRAAMLKPILLLQKPYVGSKTKQHLTCLERWLILWKVEDIDALVKEGHTIQKQFRVSTVQRNLTNERRITQKFANYMLQGKVKAAIQLLDN